MQISIPHSSPISQKSKAGGGGPSDTNYIRFLHHLTDNLLVKWESILLESRLYIQLPETSLHQGGRDRYALSSHHSKALQKLEIIKGS